MSSRSLYRWSGGMLIVGSLLILISSVMGAILFPGHSSTQEQVLSTPWLLTILLTLVGSILFLLGLPGLYLRQAGRAGMLGFVGFVLLFFVILLQGAMFSAVQVSILSLLAREAPQLLGGNTMPGGVPFYRVLLPGIMQIVGTILFGIAIMRARVFPRWTGILFLASGIAFLLTIPLPSPLADFIEVVSWAALAIACMRCGSALITGEQRAVEAAPVAAEARASL